jgi:23S rRNA pseudouridine955/2504/2580 synthase
VPGKHAASPAKRPSGAASKPSPGFKASATSRPTARPEPAVKPAAAPAELPQATLVTVDEDYAGQRLDNFLIRQLKGVPKTHVYRIIRSGEVRVNKGRAQADTRVEAGDIIRLPPVRTS